MIQTAKDARDLFDHGSKTVDEILELVERAARRNSRYIQFDGWPSEEVIGQLKQRGFSVTLSEVLNPSTKIFW